MRKLFRQQLKELNHQLIEMGALVENAITKSTQALMEHDVKLAKEVIKNDEEIDQLERELERTCLKLLLHQQPVAKDLRFISSALKIITDMERIGQHATDISEVVISMDHAPIDGHRVNLQKMADITTEMVNKSIDAYVEMDFDLAQQVVEMDDQVDQLFIATRTDLISLIHESRQNGEAALDLFLISKYFEKIGDHAESIADWVIFSIKGKYKGKRIM